MNRFFSILVFIFLFSSCSFIKVAKVNYPSPPKNAKELIEIVNSNNKTPEWLSLKGRINLAKQDQEIALNINIKYRKDSLIWASINAPLGIELFKIQISKDSIYFINRPNKTYFIKPISYIREYLKTEASFSEINEMITATPRIIKNPYSLDVESNLYIIKSESKQYKIDRTKHRIVEASISEKNQSNLVFVFSEFKEIATYFFPHHFSLKIESSKNFSAILKYSKVIFDQKQKFIFKIPSHYVEIK